MQITLVDDSIPFDGFTASSRAMGGAEKAFAALPGALARRGHTVTVYNRCRWSLFIEGAQWHTLEDHKPLATDVLIAFRKPTLLGFVRQAKRRVLWTTAPAHLLERSAGGASLRDLRPHLLMTAKVQAAGWEPRGMTCSVMPPAVKNDYLGGTAATPVQPPRAVVTTHPRHGLGWLMDLWCQRIRPAVPDAELHIFSMVLAKAAEGNPVDDSLRTLADRVLAARGHGVTVHKPGSDAAMAQAFREARIHLYPGHDDDTTAFTLMESQACGVPAVLRPLGAAPERVADGRSAYVVPDDDAFVNLTTLLLSDQQVAAAMAAEARALYAGRNWDAAAEQIEAMLT